MGNKLNEIAGIMADFMNGVSQNVSSAYRNAMEAFENYCLSTEQEAAIRIVLTHLETLARNCDEDFNLPGVVGLECNIIEQIIDGRWHELNHYTLGEDVISTN